MKNTSTINTKRLLKTFLELLRINSPSFNEIRLGEYVARRLAKAGCSVRFQNYTKSFNLIAMLGGLKSYRPLILSAHMDTIESTAGIKFAVEADRIRSIGNTPLGADDKSAIAQILEAITTLKERKIPHGDIEIVFTSAEEKGLIGAKNLDFDRIKSRHALVLDASGPVGGVVVGAPSHIKYKITVTGKSAHAGIEPEKGVNAIKAASAIILSAPDGRIDAETTANIGIIEGGTATNVVPKSAVIFGELRSHCRKTLLKTRKKIFDTARLTAVEYGAKISIEHETEYPSFRISKTDPFLKYITGVYKNLGVEISYLKSGGGSDANIFNQRGIKAINISNGMQQVHSPDEFIMLKDLNKGCEIVLEAASCFMPE